MKKYIAKNHYYVSKLNEIYINKDNESIAECICPDNPVRDKQMLKEEIRELFDVAISNELECGKIYWGFTHRFFINLFVGNPNVEWAIVLPFCKALSRNPKGLKRYWKCPRCAECTQKCFIKEFAENEDCATAVRGWFILFRVSKNKT